MLFEPIHISPSFYSPDLSQGSRMNIVDRIRPMLSASLPLTHLNDSFVIIRRIHHPFCFTDRIGYRLFDINVLSCRDSINHLQAMPVIRGGNDNGVNVSVAQQTSVIFIRQRLTSKSRDISALRFDKTASSTSHKAVQRTLEFNNILRRFNSPYHCNRSRQHSMFHWVT